MKENDLLADILMQSVDMLVNAQGERAVTQGLCHAIAQFAEHSTVFLYKFGQSQSENYQKPQLVEVTQTWDHTEIELMPLATRYQWSDFPLHTEALAPEAQWLLLAPEPPHPKTRKFLTDTLNLSHVALVPLKVREHYLGCLLAGWRETKPPESFLPLAKMLATQTAAQLHWQIEKQALQEALQEAEDSAGYGYLFDTLVDNAGDAIDIVATDGIPFYINPAFVELYEFESVNEALGADAVKLTAPEDRKQFQEEAFPSALKGMWQGELKRLRQDGTEFTAALTLFAIHEKDGTLVGVATIARDESERVKLEQSLREQARLREEVISMQRQVIRELSTPLIPITKGILIMPLVGRMDTMRAKEVTRALLAGIGTYQAKVVILDITGVPEVDNEVATYLDKMIQAARLKGADTLITGISEAIAEAVVDLGIDWGNIKTLSDLQAGLIYALRLTGRRIV